MTIDIRQNAIDAQKFINDTLNQTPETASLAMSKHTLTQAGLHYWPHTYKGREANENTDYDAIDGFMKWVGDLLIEDPVQGIYQYQVSQIPDHKIAIMASARWVDCGLPTFRLGHRKVAALMASTISKETLEHLRAPWPAFFIEVPEGLLELRDGDRRNAVKGVIVHTIFHPEGRSEVNSGLCWTWLAVTETSLVQWNINATPEFLIGAEESPDFWQGVGLDYDDYDKRVEVLIGRLIVALCLMKSDPNQFKERQEVFRVDGYHKNKKVPKDAPSYRVFVDTAPVEVDARPALHAYLSGKSSRIPTVRTLVAGHLKMQPYGHENSLRKLIWRQPYWRGPEGAPLAKRTHDLG